MQWTSLSSEELLEACLGSGGEPAWEEFVRRFHLVIARTVIKTARRCGETAPQLIDELVQETFLKICANKCQILRKFEPQAANAIFGLLKTVAFNVANDHFRSSLAQKRGAGQRDIPLEGYAEQAVAGRGNLPEAERAVLMREIDDLLKLVADPVTGARDRQIFWLHYRNGMTSRAIAAIPAFGLKQKGIESITQRLTQQVRNGLAGNSGAKPAGK